MFVAVLSDTHLRVGQTLPSKVWESIDGVDLIIHAGDILNPGLLMDLKAVAPIEAVRGNCDGWELSSLPESKIVTCERVRIGLTHGAFGVGRTTPERALRTFEPGSVDIIVFGHSHRPYKEWQGDILLFNPGSPTDKRREPSFSMGLIEVHDSEFEIQHILF